MSSKRNRLSSGVTVVCGTSFGIQQRLEGTQKRVRLNKSAKELVAEKAQYQTQLATLSFQEHEDFICTTENDVNMTDEWIDEEDAAFSRPPPGDEGFFSSHAGGEVRLQDVFLDTLAEQKCKDHRTCKDRVERQVQAWRSLLSHLVEAFLQFQSQGPPTRGPEDGNQVPWSIEIISLEGRGNRSFHFSSDLKSAAVTLVKSGVIPASPEQPRLGFTIESLQFYRQLRHICPRFSLNVFAKTLNFYHTFSEFVPIFLLTCLGSSMPYLADQLSNMYDCYLQIIRAVKKLVGGELKRGDTWDTQNVCPPCLYEVEDEVPLKFRLLAAMDGNNSLKLIDSAFCAGSAKQLTHLQAQCWKVLAQIATDLKISIVNKLPDSMF
ncbi:LOW QUALITY PROTEIN: hypothetical protein CVT25_005116 [Psilocybe cyanescens]|uniref:Uncharacterized protein n=1 Tax=Psilocybe cyanescens TaxID=93625 RepID=A0A409XMR7_PSICY|nr:LOW QUALITY PROTEIN: hypothetical protein CVT25_005116 [Psilocybe cyanescens]